MKKIIFAFDLFLLSTTLFCQINTVPDEFNFGFERTSLKLNLPDGWFISRDNGYVFSTDTLVRHSGKNSVFILQSDNRTSQLFGSVAYSIPAIYEGKEIELRAFMKLLDVTDGPIGLVLRIDGSGGSLQSDNMMEKNITGTIDWKQYSVKLPYPETAKTIYVGAILSGKGKLWVDDFELLVDGVSIEKAKKAVPKTYKAELDKEFIRGSRISTIEPTERNLKDLKTLGLIWGFLKYYHPAIAEGKINWDYELFRIIPRITNAGTVENRNKILAEWVRSLGSFEISTERDTAKADVKMYPDLSWISGSDFSSDLREQLERVINAKRTANNYYIGLVPDNGNPVIKNPGPYPTARFPDAGYRILALYSYWNIIQYYFPYKYLIGDDWKNILDKFIPRFLNASNETEYNLIALELITRIHDSHADLFSKYYSLPNYFGLNYAPYRVLFIDNKPIITNFLKSLSMIKYSLQKGDEIVSINEKPIEKIIDERLKLTPGSNLSAQLRNLAGDLLNTNDSVLHVEIKRNGNILTEAIKAYSPGVVNIYGHFPWSDTSFKLIQPDIGYLYLGKIREKYLPQIMKEIQNTKGLVIDLRCYPSEFVVFSLSSYLVAKSTPHVRFSKGSITTPGLFKMDSVYSVGEDNKDYYKGKTVILVNEETQSQAEYTAMSLRVAPGALVIGSTTAGADGDVSQFFLPGGLTTAISGIGVYYPDGRETQRVGIIPDIEVKPTIAGIIAGRDEILEKAIELLNKQKNDPSLQ